MITLIAYFFISVTFSFLAYRLYISNKDFHNKLMEYFFIGVLITAVGQIFTLFPLSIYLFIDKNDLYLFWLDILGRLTLYIATAFFAQMALSVFVKSKAVRMFAQIFYLVYGLSFFVYSLLHVYHPVVDPAGIVQWNLPTNESLAYGIPLLVVWLLTSVVFLKSYFDSKLKSTKSLLISIGFFLLSISAIAQDFGTTPMSYLLISVLLIISVFIIFAGVLVKEK